MRVTFRPIQEWPEERTRSPQRARFDTGYEETKALLERECRHLGARDVVIQVAIAESDIRVDGTYPKANARAAHAGVIVSFDSKHGPLRYATDTFTSWHDNLRAIALGLEALRKVDRYGISKGGEQYRGWNALPAGAGVGTIDAAIALLHEHARGLEWDYDNVDDVRRAFRVASKRAHPDAGGDPAVFRELTEARDLLLGGAS